MISCKAWFLLFRTNTIVSKRKNNNTIKLEIVKLDLESPKISIGNLFDKNSPNHIKLARILRMFEIIPIMFLNNILEKFAEFPSRFTTLIPTIIFPKVALNRYSNIGL